MSAISHLVRADNGPPTVSLHWICAQLGYARKTDECRERYITNLIDKRGFPAPLPHEDAKGEIQDSVSAKRSQWVRQGVEAWLGDYLPPAAAAALDSEAAEIAAAEMDEAAGNLVHLFKSKQVA